jgi:hypothetical protein
MIVSTSVLFQALLERIYNPIMAMGLSDFCQLQILGYSLNYHSWLSDTTQK